MDGGERLNTVCVLGNSGSLLSLPRQGAWPKEAHVLAVNRILRGSQDGRRFFPDSILITDGRALDTEREALQDFPGELILADFLPYEGPCRRIHLLPANGRFKTQPISDFSMEPDAPIRKINSVVWEAAQLALRMVPRGGKVLLLGVEARWPPRGDGRRSLHHHYLDYSISKPQRPFPVPTGFIHQWRHLKDWANSHNRGLYHCSPWEDLALPDIPYFDFTSICNGN